MPKVSQRGISRYLVRPHRRNYSRYDAVDIQGSVLMPTRRPISLRKYFFTNRIVNVWNSLPDTVVMSETVNQFKNKLDKFWANQDVIFNYKAELTGVGNRSSI